MRMDTTGTEHHGRDRHVALASPTRRSILAALSSEGSPRDALTLSRDLGLHVTTVRFHLERLEEAGLVRVEPAAEVRRGRPRLLYSVTSYESRDERSQMQLINALTAALGKRTSDDGRARSLEAGRRWADQIAPAQPKPGSNREVLVEVLTDLGFESVPDADGIDLRSCPFREAAKNKPEVVCSIHEGLVKRIAEQTNPPGSQLPELLPFVTPTVCRIAHH